MSRLSIRAKVDKCEICGTAFSMFHKQHECKRCSRAICWDCGKEKTIIPQYDTKVAHRTCKECRDEQQSLEVLRVSNNCSFGNLSKIGQRWFGKDGLKQVQDHYQELLKEKASPEVESILQQHLLRTFKEIKADMNYSLFDWHYATTSKENDNSVIYRINNVITVIFQTQAVRLNKQLVLLVLFMLYFCEEAIAYHILLQFLQQIIPQRFQYHKLDGDKAIDGEVDHLLAIYKSENQVDTSSSKSLRKFFDEFSTKMLSQLMINSLGFYATFFLFDQLIINRDFMQYEKMMTFIAKLEIHLIKSDYDQLKDKIIRSLQINDLQKFFAEQGKQQSISRKSITTREDVKRSASIFQEEDLHEKLIVTLNEIISEGQSEKAERVLADLKTEKSKIVFNELIQSVRNKREKYEQYKNELQTLKLKVEQHEKQLEEERLIDHQLQLESQQEEQQQPKSNKQIESTVEHHEHKQEDQVQELVKGDSGSLSKSQNNEHDQIEPRFETEYVNGLQQELNKLRIENNELQTKIYQHIQRQSVFEKQNLDKKSYEQEQQIQRLTQEKKALHDKLKQYQVQINTQKTALDEKTIELSSKVNEIDELHNNNRLLNVLKEDQDTIIMKLKHHVDSLQRQIDGYKRKLIVADLDENSKTNLIIQQLRSNIITKEAELYQQKFQIVSLNQQRLKLQQMNSRS